jgi:hypothetical protein
MVYNWKAWQEQRAISPSFRNWSDPLVWSHLFLIYPTITCFMYDVFELGILMILLGSLSTLYHRSSERDFFILEAIFAHITYLYGIIQIWYAPKTIIIVVESTCAISMLGLFIFTARHPTKYEQLHTLQHIICSIWILIIAIFHFSLLK